MNGIDVMATHFSSARKKRESTLSQKYEYFAWLPYTSVPLFDKDLPEYSYSEATYSVLTNCPYCFFLFFNCALGYVAVSWSKSKVRVASMAEYAY